MRHKTAELEPTAFGGRYTLLRRLAIGGMAEIYLARQAAMAGFEKEVVIKRLRAELADDPRIIEMFLDEARIGALLNHPNIVHVYDVDEHDGIPYIAMEYIVGEELNELCRRGIAHGRFLPLEHAVELIRQAAAGMGYFHAKRGAEGTQLADQPLDIVHLDISPSNLLVTQDGFLKVIDFGIARARGQRTRGDVMPGKLSYMSPEQASRPPDGSQSVDHRSDVFSLGIVLYEITVGKRLFRGPANEVVKRLAEAKIEPPTFFRRDFPPALEAIVMRALEKHPGDRYQTAYDLADDLESFLRDGRMHSGPVRIARYLDMLTHAAGGQRRPELVSEAEARRSEGGDELDFDSQVFDGYKPTEGAPGPDQAPEWEDTDQPEGEIAAALGLELAELRALRTPVPSRPAGMAPVTGKEPRIPTPDPTIPETEDDATATVLNPVLSEQTQPSAIETIAEEVVTPPPVAAPPPASLVAQFAAPATPRSPRPSQGPMSELLAVPRGPFPRAASTGSATRATTNRLPWMLVGGLGMAVLSLLAYILLT